MLKRLGVLGAIIALLALVVGMIAPATANDGDDRVTLRMAEKAADDEEFVTEIDVGKEGFSVGDYLVLEGEPIFNRALTKKVGVIRGDCLVVQVLEQSDTLDCDITFDLKGGLITTEGPTIFPEAFEEVQELAITGGTDAYKTAHGEVDFDFSDEAGIRFTFKLIL